MAIQILFFNDDEHTGSQDAYSRIMKTRKWIFIAGSVASALALGLYHEDAGAVLLGGSITQPPELVLRTAIWVFLCYLMGQYLLIILQLAVTYPSILRDRFNSKHVEQVQEAYERVASLQKKKDDLEAESLPPAGSAAYGQELKNRGRRIEVAGKELDVATDNYRRLVSEDVTRHPTYRHSEFAIDMLRVASPLVYGAVAMWMLVSWTPPASPSLETAPPPPPASRSLPGTAAAGR